MRSVGVLWMASLLLSSAGVGQTLDLSSLDKIGEKAREASTINLDQDKVKLASGLLGSDEKSKVALSGIKGIQIRTFEFSSKGQYSQSDLDPIRAQLKKPGWSEIVDVKDGDETSEIYFFSNGKDLGGLAIIAAEPDELSVINISGPVDLNSLIKMGGSFGGLKDLNINLLDTDSNPSTPKKRPPPPKQKPQEDDDEE